MNDEEGTGIQAAPYTSVQNGEFLRHLLDTSEHIQEVGLKLEGKEAVADNDRIIIMQTKPALVNPSLHNQIMNILSTYNVKHFVVTKLNKDRINQIVRSVTEATIDILEVAQTYNNEDWKHDTRYTNDFPAHLEGSHQEILLMVEHTVLASLLRSIDGTTLDKVTGMTTYVEQKTNANKERGGILNNVFRR